MTTIAVTTTATAAAAAAVTTASAAAAAATTTTAAAAGHTAEKRGAQVVGVCMCVCVHVCYVGRAACVNASATAATAAAEVAEATGAADLAARSDRVTTRPPTGVACFVRCNGRNHGLARAFNRAFNRVFNRTFNLTEPSNRREVQGFHEVEGIVVDIDSILVQARNIGDEVHAAFALFFLELEGDASDGSTLDALHQVSDETSDLVPQPLGGDHGNFFANFLVCVEIECKLGVVFLDDLA